MWQTMGCLGGRASRGPCLSIMKAADLRDGNYITLLRALDRAWRQRVSIKKKVTAGLVIISEIVLQHAPEMDALSTIM